MTKKGNRLQIGDDYTYLKPNIKMEIYLKTLISQNLFKLIDLISN